jgi:hypothetical protein
MKPVETATPASLVDEMACRIEAATLEVAFKPGTHFPQDDFCTCFDLALTAG